MGAGGRGGGGRVTMLYCLRSWRRNDKRCVHLWQGWFMMGYGVAKKLCSICSVLRTRPWYHLLLAFRTWYLSPYCFLFQYETDTALSYHYPPVICNMYFQLNVNRVLLVWPWHTDTSRSDPPLKCRSFRMAWLVVVELHRLFLTDLLVTKPPWWIFPSANLGC